MARLLVLAGLLLVGCKREAATVKDIAVADAAAKFSAKDATPIDANDDAYREGAGWVPGAVLLSSFNDYPLSELPEDKERPLVFYCTSRM